MSELVNTCALFGQQLNLNHRSQAQAKFDECEKLREEREQLRNMVRPGFLKDNDFIMQQQQKAMEGRVGHQYNGLTCAVSRLGL